MFKFMLLWPHQIMPKMNGLCVKIDLTEVAYFGNTRSKVGILSAIYFLRVIFFSKNGYSYLFVNILIRKSKNTLQNYRNTLQNLLNHFAVSKIHFAICQVQSKNSLPGKL